MQEKNDHNGKEMYDSIIKGLAEAVEIARSNKDIINNLQIDEKLKYKICHDIDYILEANIPGLDKIILFGSCARGDTHTKSDVDLLVVFDGELPDRTARGMVYCDLDDAVDGVRTDVVFATKDGFNTNNSAFSKQIQRDQIVLWKRDKED